MRDHILGEIRRLAAANADQPPGEKLFHRESGIAAHHWRGKFWARWSDALREAGYAPNEWQSRLNSDEVLLGVVAACRHFGRLPTFDEMALHRNVEPAIPSEQAIRRHFGGRNGLIGALAKRAHENPQFADIAAILPNVSSAPPPSLKNTDGFVYLIQSGGFYKIGRSDDLERRVKQIAVALPDKAVLVHSIRTDDPSGIEAYWHRRFADRRANGEWFKLTSLDVSSFRKRKYQ
jgi:hypothetical protein